MLFRQVAAYAEWRKGIIESVANFRTWLESNDLSDPHIGLRLAHMLERLGEDRLRVAFVAEFSRGKSELINAIFFAGYGTRMLPSAAGRTTMCPTELGFDPEKPTAIELLPIKTRLSGGSVKEYRSFSDEWTSIGFDTNDAEKMKIALQHISETVRVGREEAERLGFAVEDDAEAQAYHADAEGKVEIPRWRHAVINFPHPLLEQGLVILDTPGLNAVGTEPELTLSLLPNAHVVLFLLAADTGVTQSDLLIWRHNVMVDSTSRRNSVVVLNKIDGLWDGLKSDTEINAEIGRQVRSCAAMLDVPQEQIFPVSAQKGLVAKVTNDNALLKRSRLGLLERALSEELLPGKRDIVRTTSERELEELHLHVRHLLLARLSGLQDQLNELFELRGKNKGVVKYMMGKINTEKLEFEDALQRYHAVRNVFATLSNRLFSRIDLDNLRRIAQNTHSAMDTAKFSRQLGDAMRGFFEAARNNLKQAALDSDEIAAMMEAFYRKFSVEHGLRLGSPPIFSFFRHQKGLDSLEEWSNTHLGSSVKLFSLRQGKLTQRFFEEIALQMRSLFEIANRDAEAWIKAIMAPMQSQIREHQAYLKQRLESINRIHQATDTLEDRINELMQMESALKTQIEGLSAAYLKITDSLDADPAADKRVA